MDNSSDSAVYETDMETAEGQVAVRSGKPVKSKGKTVCSKLFATNPVETSAGEFTDRESSKSFSTVLENAPLYPKEKKGRVDRLRLKEGESGYHS